MTIQERYKAINCLMDIVDKARKPNSIVGIDLLDMGGFIRLQQSRIERLLNDQERCTQRGFVCAEYDLMTAIEKKQFKEYTKQQAKEHRALLTEHEVAMLQQIMLLDMVRKLERIRLQAERRTNREAYEKLTAAVTECYIEQIDGISAANQALITKMHEAYQAKLQEITNTYNAVFAETRRKFMVLWGVYEEVK